MMAKLKFRGHSHRAEVDDEFAAILVQFQVPDAFPPASIESHFPLHSKGSASALSFAKATGSTIIPACISHGLYAQSRLLGATDWVQGFLDLLTKGECRRILKQLWRISIKIGKTTVRIGRIIVRTFLTLLDEFPTTMAFIILMAVLSFYIARIPVIGPKLASILMIPAAIIGGVLLLFEGWMKVKTWGKFERRLLEVLG